MKINELVTNITYGRMVEEIDQCITRRIHRTQKSHYIHSYVSLQCKDTDYQQWAKAPPMGSRKAPGIGFPLVQSLWCCVDSTYCASDDVLDMHVC